MSRIKTITRIAVIAVFMVIATFATVKPAQAAKFTMLGGYKYVGLGGGIGDAVSLHGLKLHFLWSLGQRHDEDRARHLFGFGVGGGAAADESELTFFDLSLNYEYIFANGLGVSGGLGAIGVGVSSEGGSVGGTPGGGLSDLGLRYHFKNGLVLSTTIDLHSSPIPVVRFALRRQSRIGLRVLVTPRLILKTRPALDGAGRVFLWELHT